MIKLRCLSLLALLLVACARRNAHAEPLAPDPFLAWSQQARASQGIVQLASLLFDRTPGTPFWALASALPSELRESVDQVTFSRDVRRVECEGSEVCTLTESTTLSLFASNLSRSSPRLELETRPFVTFLTRPGEPTLGSVSGLVDAVETRARGVGVTLPMMEPSADMPVQGTAVVERSLKLALPEVSIARLLEFLNALEGGPSPLRVRFLRLQPIPAQKSVVVWLTVSYDAKR